jgi:tRNA-2-methylthio-N6-dimethylallyladenosine synthase
MRRTYSRERYLKLVADMRAAIPDLALTTDLIVGFPGETEDDFIRLSSWSTRSFRRRVTFVSHRAAAPRRLHADQITDALKDRVERLIDVVQRSAARRNAERIGAVEEVLVEGPSRTDPSMLRGRTRRNTTVNFSGTAPAGELVPVRIVASTSTTLRGEQVALVAA